MKRKATRSGYRQDRRADMIKIKSGRRDFEQPASGLDH
jgi:hypothetical protein